MKYLKIIGTAFVAVLWINFSQASDLEKENSLDSDILNKFIVKKNEKRRSKDKPILTENDVEIEKIKNAGGSGNLGIYKIKIKENKRSYFGKIIIKEDEAEKYEKLKEFVLEINKLDGYPKITKYRGEINIIWVCS